MCGIHSSSGSLTINCFFEIRILAYAKCKLLSSDQWIRERERVYGTANLSSLSFFVRRKNVLQEPMLLAYHTNNHANLKGAACITKLKPDSALKDNNVMKKDFFPSPRVFCFGEFQHLISNFIDMFLIWYYFYFILLFTLCSFILNYFNIISWHDMHYCHWYAKTFYFYFIYQTN